MTAERLLEPTTDAAVIETAPTEIDAIFARQAPVAMALRRSSAAERIARLKRLRDALLARRDAFHAAFHADLRKPALEVELTELLPVVDEARDAIRHLARWMRPRRVSATLSSLGNRAWIQSQPRGRCLVIGPWNYPVNTLLGPLVSALAAGNTVVLKPSELTPNVNGIVDELVRSTFDPAEVVVVQGGVATATRLLALPFDQRVLHRLACSRPRRDDGCSAASHVGHARAGRQVAGHHRRLRRLGARRRDHDLGASSPISASRASRLTISTCTRVCASVSSRCVRRRSHAATGPTRRNSSAARTSGAW